MSEVKQTIGNEIMRTAFSGKPEVKEIKEKFAELFDFISELAMKAQTESETPPTIMAPDTIARHMETIRKCEEAIRCYAEASKILEVSCMFAVKGMTS